MSSRRRQKKDISREQTPDVANGQSSKKAEAPSKLSRVATRVVAGVAMIGTFFGIIFFSNHGVIATFVAFVQLMVIKEFIAIRYDTVKEKDLPLFRSLMWSSVGIALFVAYGKTAVRALWSEHYAQFAHYHGLTAYLLFSLYFCGFIWSLKKGLYKYQMTQFSWNWCIIMMVLGLTHSMIILTYQGIFWFVHPASLVVCNDIMAYVSGMTMGKRFIKSQFLQLSPNKTWEGFIGAFVLTVTVGVAMCQFYASFDWLVCPESELSAVTGYTCTRPYVFTPQPYELPALLSTLASAFYGSTVTVVHVMPVQFHNIVFSVFASLIAPFGGFFASAVKRAFDKKDFDSIIPGHGGMGDRMDCQLINATFVWLYYTTFIRATPLASVDTILSAVALLPNADQQLIFNALAKKFT